MKKTILASLLALSMPFAVAAQDLATYSINVSLEGMTVPGAPPGVGDKSLVFTVYLDPTNADVAEEMWYTHLMALFGPEDQAELKAFSERLRQQMGAR